ncbi:MAG: hypothetical protein EBZ10_04475, partial [Actinobacteria bacterium]|nr:hypothetical protein [Actinomycetota bacterium]
PSEELLEKCAASPERTTWWLERLERCRRVVYAGYLHAMATRGWTGKRAAILGLIGFGAVIFNFTIVNLFFKGLHVYSGL